MNIPLLDLKRQYYGIQKEIMESVREVFESQSFILGKRGQDLEKKVADCCEVPWALGVASGTDALLISLRALGVGPGDAVLTTPFTFFATAGAIHNLGAIPIFLDIDPLTFNLCPERITEFLEGRSLAPGHAGQPASLLKSGRVRALLPVHLYGQMAAMGEILQIGERYGLKVLEDAAQSIGSSQTGGVGLLQSRPAGSLGDAGAISFFPSKNLGGAGDGGMIVTRREDLAESVRMLRVHGSRVKYIHDQVGWNSRLDEIQAAVLLVKLSHLPRWNQARRDNAALYLRLLEEWDLTEYCRPPAVASGNYHIYNQFVVRVRRRDELRQFLSDHGVGSDIYYPIPLHLQKCFSHLGYAAGDCPVSEEASREVLALPVFPELTPEEIRTVVGWIREFYQGQSG